jgi:hypothetical protein
MRLPALNVLSYNRFSFVASFGILALAVVGLEVLARQRSPRRWWSLCAVALLVLGAWCVYRAAYLPEVLALQLEQAIRLDRPVLGVTDQATLGRCLAEFRHYHFASAVLCGLGVIAWIFVFLGVRLAGWHYLIVAALWAGELLWIGYGRNPQCDPNLYYPRLAVFDRLEQAGPGRILGIHCFPPDFCMTQRLRDVRGYDGVDPARWATILDLARDPAADDQPLQYQWYTPRVITKSDGSLRMPPVLSMLNVRYFLAFNDPGPQVPIKLQGNNFWVYENPEVLPRVYVPHTVQTITEEQVLLHCLGAADFDPRQVAYVETARSSAHQANGSAEIVVDLPNEVAIQVDMQGPGLVVLADRWHSGWRAYGNGVEVPIIRTNYVLRGVEMPAGRSKLVFRYEPAPFYCGLWAMALALGVLTLWSTVLFRNLSAPSRPLAHPDFEIISGHTRSSSV